MYEFLLMGGLALKDTSKAMSMINWLVVPTLLKYIITPLWRITSEIKHRAGYNSKQKKIEQAKIEDKPKEQKALNNKNTLSTTDYILGFAGLVIVCAALIAATLISMSPILMVPTLFITTAITFLANSGRILNRQFESKDLKLQIRKQLMDAHDEILIDRYIGKLPKKEKSKIKRNLLIVDIKNMRHNKHDISSYEFTNPMHNLDKVWQTLQFDEDVLEKFIKHKLSYNNAHDEKFDDFSEAFNQLSAELRESVNNIQINHQVMRGAKINTVVGALKMVSLGLFVTAVGASLGPVAVLGAVSILGTVSLIATFTTRYQNYKKIKLHQKQEEAMVVCGFLKHNNVQKPDGLKYGNDFENDKDVSKSLSKPLQLEGGWGLIGKLAHSYATKDDKSTQDILEKLRQKIGENKTAEVIGKLSNKQKEVESIFSKKIKIMDFITDKDGYGFSHFKFLASINKNSILQTFLISELDWQNIKIWASAAAMTVGGVMIQTIAVASMTAFPVGMAFSAAMLVAVGVISLSKALKREMELRQGISENVKTMDTILANLDNIAEPSETKDIINFVSVNQSIAQKVTKVPRFVLAPLVLPACITYAVVKVSFLAALRVVSAVLNVAQKLVLFNAMDKPLQRFNQWIVANIKSTPADITSVVGVQGMREALGDASHHDNWESIVSQDLDDIISQAREKDLAKPEFFNKFTSNEAPCSGKGSNLQKQEYDLQGHVDDQLESLTTKDRPERSRDNKKGIEMTVTSGKNKPS